MKWPQKNLLELSLKILLYSHFLLRGRNLSGIFKTEIKIAAHVSSWEIKQISCQTIGLGTLNLMSVIPLLSWTLLSQVLCSRKSHQVPSKNLCAADVKPSGQTPKNAACWKETDYKLLLYPGKHIHQIPLCRAVKLIGCVWKPGARGQETSKPKSHRTEHEGEMDTEIWIQKKMHFRNVCLFILLEQTLPFYFHSRDQGNCGAQEKGMLDVWVTCEVWFCAVQQWCWAKEPEHTVPVPKLSLMPTRKQILTLRGSMTGFLGVAGWISLTLVHRYVSTLSTLLSTALYSWWASLLEIAPAITLPTHTHSFRVISLESWLLSWQIFQRPALIQSSVLKTVLFLFNRSWGWEAEAGFAPWRVCCMSDRATPRPSDELFQGESG